MVKRLIWKTYQTLRLMYLNSAVGEYIVSIKNRYPATKQAISHDQLKINLEPVIVFIFDDGCPEDDLSYSLFKDYGFVCCFGLIADCLNNPHNYIGYQSTGFEILSHTSLHLEMSDDVKKYKNSVADYEYRVSLEKLTKQGFEIRGLVIPYSNARKRYLDMARNYYNYILTGGSGLNDENNYKTKELTRAPMGHIGLEKVKELIDMAIIGQKLLVLYDHGIGRKGSLTVAELQYVLNYLKTKVDKGLIKVCNMQEAVRQYYGTNF